MKIALNTSQAVNDHTGVGVYTRCLVDALRAAAGEERILSVAFKRGGTGGTVFRYPVQRIAWEHLRLAARVNRLGADVFHAPDAVLPLRLPRCPSVMTVHDVSFLVCPETFSPARRIYKRVMARLSVRRAAHIVTDSKSTRRDLCRLLGVAAERITVVHPGLDDRFRSIPDPARLRSVAERFGLPDAFVLYVGSQDPRKNFTGLLEAFARCPPDLRLVVVGSARHARARCLARLREADDADRALLIDSVARDELPAIYRLASMLVYPSLYEGFGFPPLEAMACGTPVIVSNVSSLPEVVGNAALRADPYRPDELARCISDLARDEGLRRELRTKGSERAREFTWEQAASQTLDVYRRVVGGD